MDPPLSWPHLMVKQESKLNGKTRIQPMISANTCSHQITMPVIIINESHLLHLLSIGSLLLIWLILPAIRIRHFQTSHI